MILVYHHVSPLASVPAPEEREHNEGWEYTIAPEAFRNQLQLLRKRGFRFISLDHLASLLLQGENEPADTIVVTFDDGWIDNWNHAWPILKELEIPATFFVTTEHLRKGAMVEGKKMGPKALLKLAESGMTIGAHTRTHADVSRVAKEIARDEIAGSREDLANVLGEPPRFFAYPGGAFNRPAADLVGEAGYTAACSVVGGGRNTPGDRYWLYRTVLSERLNTLRDRIFLSPLARPFLSSRAKRTTAALLGQRNG